MKKMYSYIVLLGICIMIFGCRDKKEEGFCEEKTPSVQFSTPNTMETTVGKKEEDSKYSTETMPLADETFPIGSDENIESTTEKMPVQTETLEKEIPEVTEEDNIETINPTVDNDLPISNENESGMDEV